MRDDGGGENGRWRMEGGWQGEAMKGAVKGSNNDNDNNDNLKICRALLPEFKRAQSTFTSIQ